MGFGRSRIDWLKTKTASPVHQDRRVSASPVAEDGRRVVERRCFERLKMERRSGGVDVVLTSQIWIETGMIPVAGWSDIQRMVQGAALENGALGTLVRSHK